MDCTPHYIRCVKSNDAKAPKTIDKKRASHQCQYLGLPENIRGSMFVCLFVCLFVRLFVCLFVDSLCGLVSSCEHHAAFTFL